MEGLDEIEFWVRARATSEGLRTIWDIQDKVAAL
jgi:hypothetical protein